MGLKDPIKPEEGERNTSGDSKFDREEIILPQKENEKEIFNEEKQNEVEMFNDEEPNKENAELYSTIEKWRSKRFTQGSVKENRQKN